MFREGDISGHQWSKHMPEDFSAVIDESTEVGIPELAAVGLIALVIGAFAVSTGWVPLLDSANLAFHEAGHPLVGLFSERLTVYGGTLFQLLFPLLAAVHFRRRRQAAGFALAIVWLGENLHNVARYMADARAQELPLVGNGDHDWTEIFSRWHVLHLDTRIAGITHLLGWILMAGAVFWLFRAHRRSAGRRNLNPK